MRDQRLLIGPRGGLQSLDTATMAPGATDISTGLWVPVVGLALPWTRSLTVMFYLGPSTTAGK